MSDLTVFSSLAASFGATFGRIDGESSDREVMDRHAAFYRFGRALSEAAECFGRTLGAKETVYHGLSTGSMQFDSLMQRFNAPIVATKDMNVGMF